MKIQFIGSGDAFGSGGRLNTCFLVDAADTRFLIDCGATSLVGLNRCGVDPDSIDMILLSHLHGDHFGGVAFLLVHAHSATKRQRPLKIVGPKTTEQRVMDSLKVLYPGAENNPWRFDLRFEEYELEHVLSVGPVSLTAYQAAHSAGEGPACALRVTVESKTVTYSGDGGWSENLGRAASGADLFIAETNFYDKPVRFHMNLVTLMEHLDDIAAKRLILTHMDEDMLERVKSLDFETAEDGKIIEI
ncbi:MAG: MBL fold metallo-hydrolase [Rhodospirillales bacterium]|nr:MBL fold metallo-hydrolase [Alphaproteobacteria bacterium]MBL6947646.1 MBL fold metallo-hydrolase [Rhodospirillales bacterium]